MNLQASLLLVLSLRLPFLVLLPLPVPHVGVDGVGKEFFMLMLMKILSAGLQADVQVSQR